MSEPFLLCSGLRRRFGDVEAVAGVDLRLEKGHTLSLVGPSGCGKTTLLRMIAGFEAPDAGDVRLGGETLNGRGVLVPPEKRRIGMVFQDYALFPHLNVESNVAFGLRRRDRERVRGLLSLVGLDGLGPRMPHQLSGGQQQRVALARALAAEPELILLDEPFSNLDPGMRQRVRGEVRQLIESLGTTAIFVTHDQEEALSLAREVAVMLDGRVLQVGRPGEVYARPGTLELAAFLGEANILAGKVEEGHVLCELGRIPLSDGASGPVDVMIRPECIALSSDGGEPAEVLGTEYYGHDQMVLVRLPSGTRLKVRMLPSRELSVGQRCGLRLSGEVVVFPRAG